jgi:NarL family two-component system response regulator LiaR
MNEPDSIRVMLVDDHAVVRSGLGAFLLVFDDLELVGEAGGGEEAVRLCQQLKPDVVLMDLVMPRLNGIAATRQVTALDIPAKVIALTSFAENDQVFPAIQAGASSYLLKDVSPDDLVEAIRAVHRGEARMHPDIIRKLMQKVARETGPDRENLAGELTDRELEVTRLVAQGRSNHEIAQALVISEKTVKTHVSNILSKLHLQDRTQLAIYAIKNGLVDQE